MASVNGDMRDLRSADLDSKRFRDSQSKWSHGKRPSAGCKFDWWTLEAVGGSESQRAAARPRPKESDIGHHYRRKDQNFVKGRSTWDLPSRRVEASAKAKAEIQEGSMALSLSLSQPILDASPSLSLSDTFPRSFDASSSPNQPQSLNGYIKPVKEKGTERLIQREYEVVDSYGQASRGKRATQNLRKEANSMELDPTVEDDFQLI
jgi:hypothetical protein